MSGNFCLNFDFHVNLGIFYMPQIYDMGPRALLSLRRKACWRIFRPKNPTASAGFEPANLGTRGQHATPTPPKLLIEVMSKQNIIRGIFRACVMTPCRLVQGTLLLQSPLLCFRYGTPSFFREADFSRITLTMEIASSSETLVPIYQSTKCHIPQEWYICQHCFESLNGTKFYSVTEWPPTYWISYSMNSWLAR